MSTSNDIAGIYQIRNTVTGYRYIGSAVHMLSRKRLHFHHLRKGVHHSRHLQRAFIKYGEEMFEWSVLEEVADVTLLIEREQYWIDTQRPRYNMDPIAGSRLGSKQSPEAIAKLKAHNLRPEVIAKKKAELTGHAVAPETIEKIKEARAKQVTTPAMLKGLGQRWSGTGERVGTRRGATNSAEHNRKIAEKATGRKATPEAREKMRLAKLGKKKIRE